YGIDGARLAARGGCELRAADLHGSRGGNRGERQPGGGSLAPAPGLRHSRPARRRPCRHREGTDQRRRGRGARADARFRRRQVGPGCAQESAEGDRDLALRRARRRGAGGFPRHALRRTGRLPRRQGRRFLQLALQRVHVDSVPAARPRHRGGGEPEGHAHGDPDPRAHRLDRDLPPGPRRVHQAQGARVRAGCGRGGRLGFAAHVRPHPAQREPRGTGAALAARGPLHQVGGDPYLPRLRCRRGDRVLGQHARRSRQRAPARQVVADHRGNHRDGAPRHRVQPVHRCDARRARPEAEMSLLEVRDLSIEFRIDPVTRLQAVKGISFDVPARSTVALVGESGSGKSVTALSIMGLLPKENARVNGKILYGGKDLLKARMQPLRGSEIAMIFQEPMSSLNPVFSVGFQIGEVLRQHLGLSGRALRDRSIERLREVGIPEPQLKLDAYPFQLSGGQQQRVMIAMAIACEPKLLIAHEPTTALDVTVQRQILELIASLQERHEMAMLFITHDLALVSDIADQVVVMREGVIREQGPAAQVFGVPQDPYTRALLACRPPLTRRPQRLPVIDDFLKGGASAEVTQAERPRGLHGNEATLLEARGLAKSFYLREGFWRVREWKAVKRESFGIAKGKTLGVVGESGSGKTTVALLVARLHQATAGQVVFDGKNLLEGGMKNFLPYKRRIQIVFQNPYASLNPRFTVGQILTEPMQIHG